MPFLDHAKFRGGETDPDDPRPTAPGNQPLAAGYRAEDSTDPRDGRPIPTFDGGVGQVDADRVTDPEITRGVQYRMWRGYAASRLDQSFRTKHIDLGFMESPDPPPERWGEGKVLYGARRSAAQTGTADALIPIVEPHYAIDGYYVGETSWEGGNQGEGGQVYPSMRLGHVTEVGGEGYVDSGDNVRHNWPVRFDEPWSLVAQFDWLGHVHNARGDGPEGDPLGQIVGIWSQGIMGTLDLFSGGWSVYIPGGTAFLGIHDTWHALQDSVPGSVRLLIDGGDGGGNIDVPIAPRVLPSRGPVVPVAYEPGGGDPCVRHVGDGLFTIWFSSIPVINDAGIYTGRANLQCGYVNDQGKLVKAFARPNLRALDLPHTGVDGGGIGVAVLGGVLTGGPYHFNGNVMYFAAANDDPERLIRQGRRFVGALPGNIDLDIHYRSGPPNPAFTRKRPDDLDADHYWPLDETTGVFEDIIGNVDLKVATGGGDHPEMVERGVEGIPLPTGVREDGSIGTHAVRLKADALGDSGFSTPMYGGRLVQVDSSLHVYNGGDFTLTCWIKWFGPVVDYSLPGTNSLNYHWSTERPSPLITMGRVIYITGDMEPHKLAIYGGGPGVGVDVDWPFLKRLEIVDFTDWWNKTWRYTKRHYKDPAWAMMGLRYDDATKTFEAWVDGVKLKKVVLEDEWSLTSAISVNGADMFRHESGYFDIQELGVWNHKLTDEEITGIAGKSEVEDQKKTPATSRLFKITDPNTQLIASGENARNPPPGTGFSRPDFWEEAMLYDSAPGRFTVPPRRWTKVPFNAMRFTRNYGPAKITHTDDLLYSKATQLGEIWMPNNSWRDPVSSDYGENPTMRDHWPYWIQAWISWEYPWLDPRKLPRVDGVEYLGLTLTDHYTRAFRVRDVVSNRCAPGLASAPTYGNYLDKNYVIFTFWAGPPYWLNTIPDLDCFFPGAQGDPLVPFYGSGSRPLSKPPPYPQLSILDSRESTHTMLRTTNWAQQMTTAGAFDRFAATVKRGSRLCLEVWQDTPWELEFSTSHFQFLQSDFDAESDHYKSVMTSNAYLIVGRGIKSDWVNPTNGAILPGKAPLIPSSVL